MNDPLAQLEKQALADDFSGVVRVQRRGEAIVEFACGFSDRVNKRVNRVDTLFAIASGTKGFTALTIMSLIESGELTLDTTLRSVVGDDLPHVDEAVTIDHLLTHRSGVGDYLDEDAMDDIDDHILDDLSAHTLQTARDYLPLLNAHQQRSTPGERFTYNNGGFVMLSLVIETLTGSYHQAVRDRVLRRPVCPVPGSSAPTTCRPTRPWGISRTGAATSSICPSSGWVTAVPSSLSATPRPSGTPSSPAASCRSGAWRR